MYSVDKTTLISQLNSDNGIGASLRNYNRQCTIDVSHANAHPQSELFSQKLSVYSNESKQIKRLYPYQVRAATNLAYRPNQVAIRTVPTIHYNETFVESNYNYTANSAQDIGSVALNDLFTGSGKTITSLLAALEIAQNRSTEIKNKAELLLREQNVNINWSTGIGSREIPDYENVIVVFSPKHLTGQWLRATQQAAELYGVEVQVMVNPLPAVLDTLLINFPTQQIVAIFDNVRKVSKRLKFVPCIIVDEFVQKGEYNYACKASNENNMILFGRLILVSADAGDVAKMLIGLRSACLVKRWACISGNTWSLLSSVQAMATSSSLSSFERTHISSVMGLQTDLFLHTINYVPTVGGILFGSTFEISNQNGIEQFRKMGVDVTACRTIDDIMQAIDERLARPIGSTSTLMEVPETENETEPETELEAALAIHSIRNTGTESDALRRRTASAQLRQAHFDAAENKIRQSLLTYKQRMVQFSGGTNVNCPICLDDISQACILNPCWHITCSDCMKILMQRCNAVCPLCRSKLRGLVTSNVSASNVALEAEQNHTGFKATLSESIQHLLGTTPGVMKAVMTVLLCLEYHNRVDTATVPTAECFRVLVAVPSGIDFVSLQSEFSLHVPLTKGWVSHFNIHGTINNRITNNTVQKQLSQYSSEEGPPFKVLFTSEGAKDSMIGLDLGNTDALISVGNGNDMQRIGRLTRLGRSFSRGCVHHFQILSAH